MGKLGTMGLAPMIFGPLMNITGSVLASYWHRRPPQPENLVNLELSKTVLIPSK